MLFDSAATIKKMQKNTISGQLPFPFTKTKLKTHVLSRRSRLFKKTFTFPL